MIESIEDCDEDYSNSSRTMQDMSSSMTEENHQQQETLVNSKTQPIIKSNSKAQFRSPGQIQKGDKTNRQVKLNTKTPGSIRKTDNKNKLKYQTPGKV